MKEKVENIKKFVKENEGPILIGVIVIATGVASNVATKAALNSMRIDDVTINNAKDRIRVTYKNGDTDYYNLIPSK